MENNLTGDASFRSPNANGDAAPFVTIVGPRSASKVSGTVVVQIRASDDQDAPGTLNVQVSFDDGVIWFTAISVLGTLYDFNWETPAGEDGVLYTLVARATDMSGNMAESRSILVAVDNVFAEKLASSAPQPNN